MVPVSIRNSEHTEPDGDDTSGSAIFNKCGATANAVGIPNENKVMADAGSVTNQA